MAIDDVELDDLFAARLQEFVARRKKIADGLKAAGRRDDAKAVEKIPRPPVAAWAVNQIARRQPKLVKDLGRVTAELKKGSDYASAASVHRQLLADLRSEAEVVLQQGGHTPTPHLLSRVVANLRAGAADAELRPIMEAGRLTKEIEVTDFASLLAGAMPGSGAGGRAGTPAARSIATTSTPVARKHDGAADERRPQAETRQREREQAKARAQAEREAARKLKVLQAAAAAAQRDADKEARAYADAKQALGKIELRWQAARTAAQTAARALLTAQQESARRVPRTG